MENKINKVFENGYFKLIIAGFSLISATWIVMTEIRMNPMQEKLASAISDKDSMEKENKEILSKWEKSKEDISASADELISASKKTKIVTEDFSDKITSLTNSQSEFEEMKELFSTIQSELGETTKKLTKSGLNIEEKERIISINSEKISNLGNKIKNQSYEIAKTKEFLEEKNNKIGIISESLEEKNKTIEDINNKLKKSEEEIEKSKNEISNMAEGLSKILKNMSDISDSGKSDFENLKNGVNSLLLVFQSKKEELEKIKIPKMIEDITKNTKNNFCSTPDHPFEANIRVTEKGNDSINAEFFIESKVNFKVGKYTIDQAYQETCFIEAIGEFIKDVKSKTLEYNDLQIIGVFEGGADTVTKSYVGSYKGELGSSIVIHDAMVNGKNVNRSFHKGEKITNADLALLRAYSVYATFMSLADSNAMQLTNRKVNFKANEYKKHNTNNRFGKIIIQLHRKDKDAELEIIK